MNHLRWASWDMVWYLNGAIYPPGCQSQVVLKDEYVRDHSGFGAGDKYQPTPGTAGTLLLTHPHGRLERSSGTSIVTEEGSFSHYLSAPFEGVPDFVEARSYNKALDKLYDSLYQTELNLAVSLGEARESSRMIKKGLQSLGRFITVARRARKKFLANPSLTLSEVWLGMKYGWIPCLTDVFNMLQHETKRLAEVQVKARAVWKNPISPYIFTKSDGRQWAMSGYHDQRCEIAVWVAPHDQTAFDVARISSLNPLTVAWELLPLSFVVDWFVNVGGYLEAMERSFGIGLTFKRGYVTRQRKSSQIAKCETPFQNGIWWEEPRLYAQLDNTSKSRQRLTGFPRPALPKFTINLGSQRVISAAALTRTILLGKVK